MVRQFVPLLKFAAYERVGVEREESPRKAGDLAKTISDEMRTYVQYAAHDRSEPKLPDAAVCTGARNSDQNRRLYS